MKAFGIGVGLTILFRYAFVFLYGIAMRTNGPNLWWEPFVMSLLAGGAAFGLVRLSDVTWRLCLRVCIGTGIAVGIYAIRAFAAAAKFGFETEFVLRGVLANVWQWGLVMALAAGAVELLRRRRFPLPVVSR
jgi:hypothetical protein